MNRLTNVNEVIIADHGVDAMLIERDHRGATLILRQQQSFESACAAVSKIAPRAPMDEVRRLVGKHLPRTASLTDLLDVDSTVPAALDFRWGQLLRVPLLVGLFAFVSLVVGFYYLHTDAFVNTATKTFSERVADVAQDAGANTSKVLSGQDTKETPTATETPKGAPATGAPSAVAKSGAGQPQDGPLLPLPPEDAQGSSAPAADPPSCDRLVLDTLAVAVLSEGPTSVTSTSNTVRFSPSRVSKDLALRLPCTITRVPRVSDSAAFSAACRQTEQFRKRVSPSFQSLVCRSKVRGVEATVKFATAAPEGVKRSSGSAVRLPTTVIGVSPDTEVSPSMVRQARRLLLGD